MDCIMDRISPISAAISRAELRLSRVGLARQELQQVARGGEPGRRLKRRHRLGRGVVAVDEEALRLDDDGEEAEESVQHEEL